jgi:hypothetical protein
MAKLISSKLYIYSKRAQNLTIRYVLGSGLRELKSTRCFPQCAANFEL